MSLLQQTPVGLYCEAADVYIDPRRKVKRALITHAHADHAYPGHQLYLSTPQTGILLKHLLGDKLQIQTLPYNEKLIIGGVHFSFHPAGHVYGSAQIKVERKGETWVVSGDYKRENDQVCAPFEPVKCDVFITESTFGLPIFKWKSQEEIFRLIHSWWRENSKLGRLSILLAYPLGKTQHLLKHLDPEAGTIFADQASEKINNLIRKEGLQFPPSRFLNGNVKNSDLKGAILIASPSIRKSPWLYQQENYALAMVSGWTSMGKKIQQPGLFGDTGFALSDHADFEGLVNTVKETGASKILVTHGYTAPFVKSLHALGFDAEVL